MMARHCPIDPHRSSKGCALTLLGIVLQDVYVVDLFFSLVVFRFNENFPSKKNESPLSFSDDGQTKAPPRGEYLDQRP